MNISELKETFEFFDDWEDKYRFVIDLGKDLENLADDSKTDANLIRGCQSQVWFTCNTNPDGSLHFALDSDAFIVRGLISIILMALNDKPAREIVAFDMEALFAELDLIQHLSPTRGNGLRAMIARIQSVAQQQI